MANNWQKCISLKKDTRSCTATGVFFNYEIDIVAEKNDIPHFIEVKTRSSWQYGTPEEAVNRKKIQDLLKAANGFLNQYPKYVDFRIDILSITKHPEKETEYFFIEDVYL